MTSSFQGGSFQPIQTGDVTPSLQQSFQQQNRGWGRIEQMMRMNQQTAEINAGKSWEQLANLTSKGIGVLDQARQRRETRRQAEANLHFKKYGLPQDQIDEYNIARGEVRDGYNAMVELVNKDEEMDPHTKERFINLAPWKQVLLQELEAKRRASAYQLTGVASLDNARDPAEYNAALEVHNLEFLEQFGSINPVMLKEQVLDHMTSVEDAHRKSWTAARGKAMKQNRLDTITNSTVSSFDQGVPKVSESLKSMRAEKAGNKSEARSEIFDALETAVDQNLGSWESVKAIGEEEIDDYKIKDHPQLKGRWNQLREKFIDNKNSDDTRKQKFVATLANEFEDTALDNLGPLPKAGVVQLLIDQGERTYPGQTFPKLEKIRDDLSLEGEVLRSYRNEAAAFSRNGLLTLNKLKEFPWQIQQEFAEEAKLQTESLQVNQSYLKAAEALILSKSTTFPDGKAKHPTAIILAARMQNVYMDRLQHFIGEGVDQVKAEELAFAATKVEAEKYKKNKFGKGWNIGLPSPKDAASKAATIAATMTEQTEALSNAGLEALTVKGLWGSDDQLKQDYNSIKTGKSVGWIRKIRKIYPHLDDVDIYNMYAVNMGDDHKQIEHPQSHKIQRKYQVDPKTKAEFNAVYNDKTINNSIKFFRLVDDEDALKLNFNEFEQDTIKELSIDYNNNLGYTSALAEYLFNDEPLMKEFNIPDKEKRDNFSRKQSRKGTVKRKDLGIGKAIDKALDDAINQEYDPFGFKKLDKVNQEMINSAFQVIHAKFQAAQLSRKEKLASGWTLGPRGGLRPPQGLEDLDETNVDYINKLLIKNDKGKALPTLPSFNIPY